MSAALTLLQIVLLLASGAELESDGRFVEAGIKYEENSDVHGQLRILCRFLEESLYAGETDHAFLLIQAMEQFPVTDGNLDFWYARLAWSCGLPEMACRELDTVSGSNWLVQRSRGMAAIYRGDPETALELLDLSWSAATTVRERFYSSLDICFALIQSGRPAEAEQVAARLTGSFPGEGLPPIALALSMREQERFGASMTLLQDVATDTMYTGITRTMADAMLKDME